jgi:peptide/nickel transport system substrate-binding protein
MAGFWDLRSDRAPGCMPRNRLGRTCRLIAAAAIALLSLAPVSGPARAQTLRIGTQSPFVIDPHYRFLGPDMAAARMVFDSFVGRDGESVWVPALALSWTPVDETTWEFKLRPGVTFSDGTPFTADDVAYSFQRVMTLETPSSYRSNMRSIVRWEVVDPLTLRVITDRPNAVLPGQLTNIFIVSRKMEAASLDDIQAGRAALGTGPFKVDSYLNGVRLQLTRNDRYWGQKPAWEHVDERVMSNDAARISALLAGDVDLIDDVAPTDAATLQREPAVKVYRHASDRVMFLVPNVRLDSLPLLTDETGAPLPHNPLRDVRVRRAVSLAINRETLAARGLDGAAVPNGALVPASFGGYDPAPPVPPYDPAAARKLLAEAGYPNGFGMTIACTNDRYFADAKVCQILGQMLERIGLRMKVETQPGNVLFGRLRPESNTYPLVLLGQSNSTSRDPTHVLDLALHTLDRKAGLGSSNRGGFSDPKLDQMIDAAVARIDDKREAALHDAMMYGVQIGALIPLYTQVVLTAARNGILYHPRMDEQTVAQAAFPAR